MWLYYRLVLKPNDSVHSCKKTSILCSGDRLKHTFLNFGEVQNIQYVFHLKIVHILVSIYLLKKHELSKENSSISVHLYTFKTSCSAYNVSPQVKRVTEIYFFLRQAENIGLFIPRPCLHHSYFDLHMYASMYIGMSIKKFSYCAVCTHIVAQTAFKSKTVKIKVMPIHIFQSQTIDGMDISMQWEVFAMFHWDCWSDSYHNKGLSRDDIIGGRAYLLTQRWLTSFLKGL